MSWVVCSVCRGNGKHVNPSIDANGLSGVFYLSDPEFMEDYMEGVYDVGCKNCDGTGKVFEEFPGQNDEALNSAAEDRRLAAAEDGDWEAFSSAHDHRW